MTADLDGLSLGRAEALLELGRAGEARTLLQALLASAPENVYVWCLLSQACLGCEDPAGALDAASLAAGLDGDEEWAHRLRASALDQLGRGPDAVAAAEEAVRCAPHSWQTHACLADMLADNPTLPPHLARCEDRALAAARRAAELAPSEPVAHLRLAQAHAQREDWERMRAASSHAVSLAPDDASLLNDVAVAELRVGFHAVAAAGFARAAALDPRGPAPANFALTCRHLFDSRVRRTVLAMWVGGLVARAIGSSSSSSSSSAGDTDLKLRLWAAFALLAVLTFLLKPVADFLVAVPARHRHAVAAAVRRDRRIAVQVSSLFVASLLCTAAVAVPAPVRAALVVPAIALYVVAAVLTWGGGSSGAPADDRDPDRPWKRRSS